jgi:hypoxanthine phosphoribosyltransferase
VAELAEAINRDYAGRDLVMIGVLKGAFIFLADLVRALPFSVDVDFVRLCSYGAGTTPSGEVHITKDVELSLKDRDVLIVEDIVDLGFTLNFLPAPPQSPAPLAKIAVSLTKRNAGRWRCPWIMWVLSWRRVFWWATVWIVARRVVPFLRFMCSKRIKMPKRATT